MQERRQGECRRRPRGVKKSSLNGKKDLPQLSDCLGLSEAVRAHAEFEREIPTLREPIFGVRNMRRTGSTCSSKGQVAEFRGPSAANRIITRVVIPGELFGHLCFCSPKDGVRGSSARATSDVVALEVKLPESTRSCRSWRRRPFRPSAPRPRSVAAPPWRDSGYRSHKPRSIGPDVLKRP